MLRLPERSDINAPVNEQLIVELYSRLNELPRATRSCALVESRATSAARLEGSDAAIAALAGRRWRPR